MNERTKSSLHRSIRLLIENLLNKVECGVLDQPKISDTDIAALYSIRRYFSRRESLDIQRGLLEVLNNVEHTQTDVVVSAYTEIIPGCGDMCISPSELGTLRRTQQINSFNTQYITVNRIYGKSWCYEYQFHNSRGLSKFSGISIDLDLCVKQIGNVYVCRLYEKFVSSPYGEVWIKRVGKNDFLIDRARTYIISPLLRRIDDPSVYRKDMPTNGKLFLRRNLIQYLGLSVLHDLGIDKLYVTEKGGPLEYSENIFVFFKTDTELYPFKTFNIRKDVNGVEREGIECPVSFQCLTKTILNSYLELVAEPQFAIKAVGLSGHKPDL